MEKSVISARQFILIYTCWVLAMILGILALVSAREWGLSLLAVQKVDLKLVGLVDKIVFFFMGVAGLCIIVLSEGYFRTGAKRGQLAQRIGLVFGLELLAMFFFDAGRLLMPDIVDAARPGLTQTAMNLLIGALGCWVYWTKRK